MFLILCLLLVSLVIIVPIIGYLVRIYDISRIRRDKTVVSEYEAPYGLEPAELGYLLDNDSRNLEFIATLIVLVQKGALKILRDANKKVYFMVIEPNKAKLSDIEISALGWVQNQDKSSVYWSQLNDGSLAGIGGAANLRDDTLTSLISKGYISKNIRFSWLSLNIYGVMAASTILVVGLIILLSNSIPAFSPKISGFNSLDSSLLVMAGMFSFAILYPVFVAFFRFIAWLYAKTSGRPYSATTVLKSRWREIAGYQLFLKTVEFDRIKSEPIIQNKNLPYAVPLGLRLNMDELDLSYK